MICDFCGCDPCECRGAAFYVAGFKLIRVREELHLIDLAHHRKWRMTFPGDPEMPFVCELLDADCHEK